MSLNHVTGYGGTNTCIGTLPISKFAIYSLVASTLPAQLTSPSMPTLIWVLTIKSMALTWVPRMVSVHKTSILT